MKESEQYTVHAEKRMQERGQTQKQHKVLLEYGTTKFRNGAWRVHLTKEDLLELASVPGDWKRQDLDRLAKIYLVVIDGRIITCAEKNKNWGKNYQHRWRRLPTHDHRKRV